MYNINIIDNEGKSTFISSNKIPKTCRACLLEDGIIDLFQTSYQDLTFRDLFALFSIFQVIKEDGFPQKICQKCADLVTQLYSFKQKVAENQIILQLASKNKKTKVNLIPTQKIIPKFYINKITKTVDNHPKKLETVQNLAQVSSFDKENNYSSNNINNVSEMNEKLDKHDMKLQVQKNIARDHDYYKSPEEEWTCPCCFIKFYNRSEFISHRMMEIKQQKINNKEGLIPPISEFACTDCNIKFKSHIEYVTHLKQKAHPIEKNKLHPAENKFVLAENKFPPAKNNFVLAENKLPPAENNKNFICKCNANFNYKFEFLRHRRQCDLHTHDYTCTKCNLKFTSRYRCIKHKRKHLEYTCSICKLKFNSRTDFILHRKQEHKNPQKNSTNLEYTCPYCRLKFNSRSVYLKHRKEETRKNLECPYCKKNMHMSLLDKHVRLIHKKLPPLKCEVCGTCFVSETLYNRHLLAHKDGFFCEKCGTKCLTISALNAHVKSHETEKSPRKCHICNKDFIHLYLYREHMYKHTGEKPYLCSVCGATFNSQTVFQRHNLDKHTICPFKCDLCGKSYETEKKFDQHIERHNNKKNNECEICGRQFLQKACLVHHMTTHDGHDGSKLPELVDSKIVNCLSCNKPYDRNSKTNLELHIRSHIGESSYLCLFCGKQFDEENEFNFHSVLHGDRKLKPIFTCDICHSLHASKASLESHLRYHSGERPFRCEHCGKAFYIKAHLTTHLFWHTGKKPFSCKFCGKAFSFKGNLEQHERTHRGQRDYVCNVCGKGFYTGSSLRKHQQIHFKNFSSYDLVTVNEETSLDSKENV